MASVVGNSMKLYNCDGMRENAFKLPQSHGLRGFTEEKKENTMKEGVVMLIEFRCYSNITCRLIYL